MRVDNNGIPILSDAEIEARAEGLLETVDQELLIVPCEAPIGNIFEFLKKEHGVQVEFCDLGVKNGYKILGRVVFSTDTILIDEKLPVTNNSSFLFTCAHEIGHWLLHSSCKIKIDKKPALNELSDDEGSLRIRKKSRIDSPARWLEHQANVFAASLLMPKNAVINAVVQIQKDLGINRNLGEIHISKEVYTKRDFSKILDGLHDIFQTSFTAMKIRLEECGVIIDQEKPSQFLYKFRLW